MKHIVLRTILKYKLLIGGYWVLGIILNIANLYTNVLNKNVMDNVFYKNNILIFYNYYLYQFIALLVLVICVNIMYVYVGTVLAAYVDCKIKLEFHEKFLRYPESFFDNKSCIDIYFRMFNDLKAIYSYWVGAISTIPVTVLYLFAAMFLMILWSKLLFVLYIVFMMLNVISLLVTKSKIYNITMKQRYYEQELMKSATSDFDKILTVQSLGIEDLILKWRGNEYNRLKDYNIKSQFILMLFSVFSELGIYIWNIVLISVGAILVASKKITLGEYITFSTLAVVANAKVKAVFNIFYSYPTIKASLSRVNNYISDNGSTYHLGGSMKPEKADVLCLEIKEMSFSYEKNLKTIRSFNEIFTAPCIVTITGRNGGGKTTLLKLLDRLLEPLEGEIRLNGIKYSDIDNEYFHKNVFYLEQHGNLFNLSLRENIIFSQDTSCDEKILNYFESFDFKIDAILKQGLDTIINSDGKGLSIGMQQKIMIVRMLMSKARILLLDEPVASLDEKSKQVFEVQMKKYIDEMKCIVIYVTHEPMEHSGKTIRIGEADEN